MSDTYLARADELEQLACRCAFPLEREGLLRLAQGWRDLARQVMQLDAQDTARDRLLTQKVTPRVGDDQAK